MGVAYKRAAHGPVAGGLAGEVVAISGTGGGQGCAAALLFALAGAVVGGAYPVSCRRRLSTPTRTPMPPALTRAEPYL
jgi:NAD(P)-dependent dehydrogenase (short-subunit alcohol dehydrogenase family)